MSSHRHVSRRTFLSALGLTAAGLSSARALHAIAQTDDAPPLDPSPTAAELNFIQPQEAQVNLVGRITGWTPVREVPEPNTRHVDQLGYGTVVPLLEAVSGKPSNGVNELWWRIQQGYIYTATVQPMQPYRMPTIMDELPHTIAEEPGFWAEVIIPEIVPYTAPNAFRATDEYFGDEITVTTHYGSVHRVTDIFTDDGGNVWYEIVDDKPGRPRLWVLARHMRYLPPAEFEPIAPGRAKLVRANLSEQRIDCYLEGDLIYSTLTSSGSALPTPLGQHAVVYKQPSRHMYSDPENPVSGGDADDDFFDLPGVPFNTFFTTAGHAIHGTWWHGDYGRPRSHGCLNVTPEAARWIYRFVEPVAGYDQTAAGSSANPGTEIVVDA